MKLQLCSKGLFPRMPTSEQWTEISRKTISFPFERRQWVPVPWDQSPAAVHWISQWLHIPLFQLFDCAIHLLPITTVIPVGLGCLWEWSFPFSPHPSNVMSSESFHLPALLPSPLLYCHNNVIFHWKSKSILFFLNSNAVFAFWIPSLTPTFTASLLPTQLITMRKQLGENLTFNVDRCSLKHVVFYQMREDLRNYALWDA